MRLLTHARVREELLERFPEDWDRLHFVEDSMIQRHLAATAPFFRSRPSEMLLMGILHAITQKAQVRAARRLVRRHSIELVHEPIPVSPRMPSALETVGAPVVIGPMNGGMIYPPGFRNREGLLSDIVLRVARRFADPANRLWPGKLRARMLLVANERTRNALPLCLRGVPVRVLVENGVDLDGWKEAPWDDDANSPVRFATVGRLVDFKAIDLLIEAFAQASREVRATLEVYGDGERRADLEHRVRSLGVSDSVVFHGSVPQERIARSLGHADALCLPSLFECGGAVVLEAMAVGRPVVASRWGGPVDYLDDRSGILVEPRSREQFVRDFRDAMVRLAKDPGLRRSMGRAGRARVEREFDWERKVDRFLDLVRESLETERGRCRREHPGLRIPRP